MDLEIALVCPYCGEPVVSGVVVGDRIFHETCVGDLTIEVDPQ